MEDAIKEEYEIAAQVSDEEWEAIRPMKLERRNFLLKSVKVLFAIKCYFLVSLMSFRNICLTRDLAKIAPPGVLEQVKLGVLSIRTELNRNPYLLDYGVLLMD